MMDTAHASDTLFLVAEADFRYYQADDMKPAEWSEIIQSTNLTRKTAKAKSASRDFTRHSHSDDLSFTKCSRPEKDGFVAGGQKGAGENMNISQELIDTVTICNEADRRPAEGEHISKMEKMFL